MRAASEGVRNARNRVADTSRPPWARWRTKTLHGRAIKFLQTQCIPRKGHGAGQPLRLGIWQKNWLEEVLGNAEIEAALMTLGRGNGKSTFAGGLATWATFDPVVAEHFGGQPDCPIIAQVLRQAEKGVYGAAEAFTKGNPELSSRSIIYTASGKQAIVVPSNADASCYPVAADEDHLQGLDFSVAFVDEVGLVPVESWNALRLAEGKRPRSLLLGLGTRRPGNAPNTLDSILGQVAIHGNIEGLHVTDFTAPAGCDINDPRMWALANPSIASGFLRSKTIASEVKTEPESLVRTFRLNQKVNDIAGWLGADGAVLWHKLRDPYVMEAGAPTWVGVDSSYTGDCSAVVWCQNRPDGRTHVEGKVWTPHPGAPVPWDEMEDLIRQLAIMYRVDEVSYDPKYFARSAQLLEQDGVLCVETPQSHARMSVLCGETYRRITAGTFSHDADAQLSSHILNAVKRVFPDAPGFSLSRKKSTMKIDGAIAMCLAVGASVLADPPEAELDDAMLVLL